MPSTHKLIFDLGLTAALLTAGGWLASQAGARATEPAPAAAAPIEPAAAAVAGLELTVADVRSSEGRVIVLVFDQAVAYAQLDYDGAAAYAEQPAQPGQMRFVFEDLAGGPYAIFAFHDANGDYDLEMDGPYPLEGYGGTGMARWHDDPSFAQAATARGEAEIRLHYLERRLER